MIMTKHIFLIIILSAVTLIHIPHGEAAVGCTLNDPDRDIIRVFPDSTGYKTEFITIEERGDDELMVEVETKLGDKLDDVYETSDVPYAYYTILKGKEPVGYMHGVNQKGMYGGMQLILATDLQGKIIDFYYQKISSPEAKKFNDDGFTEQFAKLTLENFTNGSLEGITDPSEQSSADFNNTLRGLKKNLILLDIFKLERKYTKE